MQLLLWLLWCHLSGINSMFLKSDQTNRLDRFNWESNLCLVWVSYMTGGDFGPGWTGQNRKNQWNPTKPMIAVLDFLCFWFRIYRSWHVILVLGWQWFIGCFFCFCFDWFRRYGFWFQRSRRLEGESHFLLSSGFREADGPRWLM